MDKDNSITHTTPDGRFHITIHTQILDNVSHFSILITKKVLDTKNGKTKITTLYSDSDWNDEVSAEDFFRV